MAELGEMRHRIQFLQPATKSNGYGATVRDPESAGVSVGYARAMVKNKGLGERTEGGQTVAVHETLFRCRKPRAFTPNATMFILFNDVAYHITRVEDWNDDKLLDVWATKRDSQ